MEHIRLKDSHEGYSSEGHLHSGRQIWYAEQPGPYTPIPEERYQEVLNEIAKAAHTPPEILAALSEDMGEDLATAEVWEVPPDLVRNRDTAVWYFRWEGLCVGDPSYVEKVPAEHQKELDKIFGLTKPNASR